MRECRERKESGGCWVGGRKFPADFGLVLGLKMLFLDGLLTSDSGPTSLSLDCGTV